MPETPTPDPWVIDPDEGDGGDYDKALDAHDQQQSWGRSERNAMTTLQEWGAPEWRQP